MSVRELLTRPIAPAWAVLIASLAVVMLAWIGLREQNEQAARKQFDSQVHDIEQRIVLRMRRHEMILLSGAGLFDASDKVDRGAWHRYAARLDLATTYPGIQGLGFAQLVKPAELNTHIAAVRAEGFHSYTVRPAGEREAYMPIVYLEPFEGRNLAAFGYDMFSEATRNAAMRRAGQTGRTAISGKVKLVQETHGKTQAGFLMYVPLYRYAAALDTPEQRWQALRGFVYSPYRMDDLMRGVIGQRDPDVDFSIYDGEASGEDDLMYVSADEHELDGASDAAFTAVRRIESYGRTWTLSFRNRPGFVAKFHPPMEWLLLMMGVGISFALFAFTWTLVNRREQALALADRMSRTARESEQRWLSMLENSPTAARIALAGGRRVVFSNRRYAELVNLPHGQASDIDPASYYASRSVYEEVLACLQRGEQIMDRMVELVIPGFGTKWALASYFPLQFEGEAAVLGWFHDITDRKRAEESERAQARQTQAILDNTVDGIITIDMKGTVRSLNQAAVRLFAYEPEEVMGCNVKMLMPEPYRSGHDGYLQNYMRTGDARIIGIGREVTGQRKNGSTFPMDLAVSEISHDDERMFIGLVRDITERKRVDRMKTEFVSTVSHELRTPLTAIRGSLGLLSGGVVGELPEQAKAMLNIATNNTERLLMLINDILDIQKIEAGKMAFRFENVELMPLLERAVSDLGTYADQHRVRFEITHRVEDVHIYADRERLMQVLANLMSNAAKFSPPDSKVEIACARHQDGRVRVSVTDFGPGIPEEFKPRIFQAFSQSDSSDTRDKGGTGLGLAITKAIVDKHGGQIAFITREGIGTTFYVELPEMLGGEQNSTETPRAMPATHRACVLIVEDDPDIAALIRRLLTEAGYDSDIAYSASQARQLLNEQGRRYRLMTLDLQLPDEDGMSLLESLRRDAATRDLPVVVVSLQADEARRQLIGGALDVRDWLQKPIDAERLCAVVQSACGQGSLPSVLHVEDEPDVRAIVATMLKGYCSLSSADTMVAAREALDQGQFDLVLLDIGLPDGSGLDLIEAMERTAKPPRIVIFSANDVTEEYSDKVSAVLVKSRSGKDDLLRVLLQSMGND